MTLSRKMLSISANHRANAELYATLLGQLANVRYEISLEVDPPSSPFQLPKRNGPILEGAQTTERWCQDYEGRGGAAGEYAPRLEARAAEGKSSSS